MHLTLASSLLLASGAAAQYGYGGGSGMSSSTVTDTAMSSSMPAADMAASSTMPMMASSTMAAGAAGASGMAGGMVNMHVVKVSNKNGDLVFEPKDLQAKVGEMVQFHFYPKNHSVVQAAFDSPCAPMAKGLFSGYMPVKAADTVMPAYTIMVNDTKPIWYYCSQGTHCQSGMVGVINAPAANQSRTVDAFAALAKNAQSNTSPMEGTTGGTASSSTGNASTTMMTTAAASGSLMPMPSGAANASGAATQAKSGASRNHNVFAGVGLAAVAGMAVAFVL